MLEVLRGFRLPRPSRSMINTLKVIVFPIHVIIFAGRLGPRRGAIHPLQPTNATQEFFEDLASASIRLADSFMR